MVDKHFDTDPRGYLDPGETLIWRGAPDKDTERRKTMAMALGFILATWVFAFTLLGGMSKVEFLMCVAVTSAWGFIWINAKRGNDKSNVYWFAISDRRILFAFITQGIPQVREALHSQIIDFRVKPGRGDVGTIVFRTSRYPVPISFYDVADVNSLAAICGKLFPRGR